MKAKVIISLFIMLLLASCGSNKDMYRLVPEMNQQSYWMQGTEFLVQKKNDVEVAVAFNSFIEKELIFELKVTNHSGKPVIVDPKNVNISFGGMHEGIVKGAVDPERRLDYIRQNINESESNIESAGTASIIGTIIYGVAAVASAASDDDDSDYRTRDIIYDGLHFRDEMEYEKYNERQNIAYLNDKEEYWQKFAFRKTTIQDGFYHNGAVHFLTDYRPHIKVTVNVEGLSYEFYYSAYELHR